MKTNKLPKSAWSDSQAAGSQSQQTGQSSQHYLRKDYLEKSYLKKGYVNKDYLSKGRLKIDSASQTGHASNDASYHYDHYNNGHNEHSNHLATDTSAHDSYFGYKSVEKSLAEATESAMIKKSNRKASSSLKASDMKRYPITNNVSNNNNNKSSQHDHGYKKAHSYQKVKKATAIHINESVDTNTESLMLQSIKDDMTAGQADVINSLTKKNKSKAKHSKTNNHLSSETAEAAITEIPERIFMNGLIKHTGIALAIIIPLAAFSAYAATPPFNTAARANVTANATTDKISTETLSIKPSAIIHKSASVPTTVDSVDLKKYAGTWYEIGRLPMYFQRNCASDVTANYVEKTDGSGIKVINQCKAQDGSGITAEGLAKPADGTGSKLKVTFLPSWIRWLPVGRADYWVLARDADYKTALVGTPDKKYLWLLARSPNVSQETYAKYRQIAQQQGYDLKEFKLTTQTNQTVKLVP
ncbi:apolipoprotein D and lipocalin family protein [Psychrobacter luti]|uniref:Apolipoprotein D and lipocalin family protein n=1 Tax=Psychrobacter luti TaxID=198481 RepID=A0A839TEC5_9GAMM|nr:lipocalin family protein [Psychrobacter luti]MBB3107460.1 apolipoprotein D and lipocalin family protein [Psychrobacter luti]